MVITFHLITRARCTWNIILTLFRLQSYIYAEVMTTPAGILIAGFRVVLFCDKSSTIVLARIVTPHSH